MLYPFMGKGQKISDFVLFLIDLIMEDPFTEQNKQKLIDGEYNPLAKKGVSMLEKIYNGSREISEKDAGIILSHFNNPDKFDDYMAAQLSQDVLDLISKDMQRKGITIENSNVSGICANIFFKILNDCATKNKRINVYTTEICPNEKFSIKIPEPEIKKNRPKFHSPEYLAEIDPNLITMNFSEIIEYLRATDNEQDS
jgi:hypothetical protein